MRGLVATAVALVAGLAFAFGGWPSAQAQSWPGCDTFTTQPEAQAFWESHGRPAVADGDADGKVCESLPPGGGGGGYGCTKPDKVVEVRLSRAKYPEATLHFEVAWKQGVPRRYTIARRQADKNRAAWDPLVPPGVDADGDGKKDDRDEVPMAFTKEGGRQARTGTRRLTSPTWTPRTTRALAAQ